MGASPSQHLTESDPTPGESLDIPWPLQDDLGVVIALPAPPPLKRPTQGLNLAGATKLSGSDFNGRRVLAVQSGSPAAKAGLVPWLDFIIGVDGRLFSGEEENVLESAKLEPGKRTKLHVFNIKTLSIRDCVVIPVARNNENDHINGNGTTEPSSPSRSTVTAGAFLGLKISSWQIPDVDGIDKCIRVLGLEKSSPAQECGLEPETDYLLGTIEHGAFGSLDDLEYALIDKENKTLEMFVYNSSRDDIRIVSLRPRTGWSPYGGLLGAELANGILHRIPASCRRTPGKDRNTAGEQDLSQNDIVRTPEGLGELLVRHADGSVTVRLDWGLGNDCEVIGKFAAKNVDYVTGGGD